MSTTAKAETTPPVPIIYKFTVTKREKGIQHSVILYYCRLPVQWHMSKLAKQKWTEKRDSTESFGKFNVSELHDIQYQSNDYVLRKAKRKIQHSLMDAWDKTDSTSLKSSQTHAQLSDTYDSSQWDEVKSCQPVSLDERSFNENVILNENSCDAIRIALQNKNLTEEDYSMSS